MYCFAIFHSKRIHLYGFPFVVYWDCLPLIHGSRSSTSGISGSSWITCCSAASSWSRASTSCSSSSSWINSGSRTSTSTKVSRGGSRARSRCCSGCSWITSCS
uniref:Uncharacterized protein n=1 Tax=Cacopsylla melanoneura TaxID=428564 RepID=A0A8D9F9Z1_9HEMI